MTNIKKKGDKKEPEHLVGGKEFHEEIQKDWKKTAEYKKFKREKEITKPSGRKGRIDIFVDAGDNLVAVVEIKASDWDRMTIKAVCRNVRRQANQIWDYIESQLEQGKEVSPGIILKERPKVPERLKLIEHLFADRGIPVVWKDQSIEIDD